MLHRNSVSSIRLSLALLALSFLCASPVAAQQSAGSRAVSAPEETSARKIDEFVGAGSTAYDFGDRLDALAAELRENPRLKALVIYYDGVDDAYTKVITPRHLLYHKYLVSRVDDARVSAINGGFRKQQMVELWVMPDGAPAPLPTETVAAPARTGRTYKYSESYIPLYGEPAEEIIEDEDQSVEDFSANEDASETTESEEDKTEVAAYPKVPESAKHAGTMSEEERLSWASEEFASAVKQEKDGRACLIYYADSELRDMRRAQAVIARGKNLLVEKYSLKPDNIVVIYGGYRFLPTVELWVVPLNNSLPAATPKER